MLLDHLFLHALVLDSCFLGVGGAEVLNLLTSLLCSIAHDVEIVPQWHLLKGKLVVKELVRFEEAVGLRQDSLEHGATLLEEVDILVAEGLGVKDLLHTRSVVDGLTQELKDLLGFTEGCLQALGPVHKVERVLPRWVLEMLKDSVVIDVRHLLGQLADCVLAVAMEVDEC